MDRADSATPGPLSPPPCGPPYAGDAPSALATDSEAALFAGPSGAADGYVKSGRSFCTSIPIAYIEILVCSQLCTTRRRQTREVELPAGFDPAGQRHEERVEGPPVVEYESVLSVTMELHNGETMSMVPTAVEMGPGPGPGPSVVIAMQSCVNAETQTEAVPCEPPDQTAGDRELEADIPKLSASALSASLTSVVAGLQSAATTENQVHQASTAFAMRLCPLTDTVLQADFAVEPVCVLVAASVNEHGTLSGCPSPPIAQDSGHSDKLNEDATVKDEDDLKRQGSDCGMKVRLTGLPNDQNFINSVNNGQNVLDSEPSAVHTDGHIMVS